jgi:hypothetical protein
MKLPPDELLQVVKPLYGLAVSGYYWYETLTSHHIKKLLMEQSTGEFHFSFARNIKNLMTCSALMSMIYFKLESIVFAVVLKCTAEGFDSKPPEEDKFVFT